MNDRVIKILQELLARAERGNIIALAVATLAPDLATGSIFTLGDGTFAELLGSVSLMQHRLMVAGESGPLD